jgi:hypothetical protein
MSITLVYLLLTLSNCLGIYFYLDLKVLHTSKYVFNTRMMIPALII